jgi:hypothetical protein
MAHGVGLSLEDEDDSQQECSYCSSDLSSEDDGYSEVDLSPPLKPPIARTPTSHRRRLETHDAGAVQRPQPPTSAFYLPLPRPRAASMDERGFYALGSAGGGGGSPGGVSAIRRRLEEWHRDNPSSSSSLERSDHSDLEVEGNDVDSSTARLRRGGNRRSNPWRLCLSLVAVTMVVLANQDFLLGPGRNLQEDLRQKEVAFPFRYRSRQQQQQPLADQGSTIGSSATHGKGPTTEQYRAAVAELPKFYFPQKQQSLSPDTKDSLPATTQESATTTNGTPPGKVRHRGYNLSYARGMHQLPVFGGGTGGEALLSETVQHQILRPAAVDNPPRLKVEQFYLATSNEDEGHENHSFATSSNQWNPPHPRKARRSFSWATWLSGMVLCSMIVEAIWKEYRQYRINSRVGRHQRHQ